MINILQISSKTLIITPNHLKRKLLKSLNEVDYLVDVKILSFPEFLKHYKFDYDKKTLYYMKQKYGLSPSTSKVYLDNMYYLEDCGFKNFKISQLIEMKNDLLEQNLLKTNPFFVQSLKDYDIVSYGYDYFLKEQKEIFLELQKITSVKLYLQEKEEQRNIFVHQFQTIDEELEYVMEEISSLIASGIPSNKIKIVQPSEEYIEPLMRFSSFYELPIEVQHSISIYETMIGKKTLQYLQQGKQKEELHSLLKEAFSDSPILYQILTILNQYAFLDSYDELEEFLIEDMKHTYLETEKFSAAIEIIPFKNNIIDADTYVFVLGFNHGNYPRVLKDEDFFDDEEKKAMNFSCSKEINRFEKESLIYHMFATPKLFVSYKMKTDFEVCYPSTLIQDYHFEVIEQSPVFKVHHSSLYDQIKLAGMLDSYIQKGRKHPLLEKYYTTLKIPYLGYQHQYKPIQAKQLQKFLNTGLLLSYSSLDRFYHCSFRYYLQDILKISKYEERLSTVIGNVFHAILSRCFESDFCFEEAYEKACSNYLLSLKDTFYLQKLKPTLLFVIQEIKKQNQILGFSHFLTEQKFFVEVQKKPLFPVLFMGVIDKILWSEKEGKKSIALIDYKTGSTTLDLSLSCVGLQLQLPTYMYLLSKSSMFQNGQIVGMYLQKILNPPGTYSKDSSLEKAHALKLQGYSICDEDILSQWDPTFENSEVIRNLKKTKTGWYRYAKLLTSEEMQNLTTLTEDKILNASKKILNAEFSINPKRINGKNVGCEYCSFRDICYHKEADIIDVSISSDLSQFSNLN